MKTGYFTIGIIILILGWSGTSFAEDPKAPNRDYLSRMFIGPTGRMLPTGMVNVAFGGAFASQGGREYLGLFSIGLGGVAEIEVSTSHLLSNIFNFAEPYGATALKFIAHKERAGSLLPTTIIALRSNRWSTMEGGGDDFSGPASGHNSGSGRIYHADFETHLTSLYVAMTKELSPTYIVHGGLVWHEARIRDITFYTDYNVPAPRLSDKRKNIIGISAGLEHSINENTTSLFEIGTLPRIVFANDLKSVDVESLLFGMAGVRYYLFNITSVDAGLRYRSDYSGLSDIEIRAGLNVGLDLVKAFKRKPKH